MSRSARLAMVIVALLLGAAPGRAEDRWFAAAGFEWPRLGQGDLGRWNHGGPSFAIGVDHPILRATGLIGRLTAASFPPDENAIARDRSYLVEIDVGTASLVTLAGGVRFRRYDLGFSPYFEAATGVAFAKPDRFLRYPGSAAPMDDRGLDVGWYWTWGAGFAMRASERLGAFLDGHWDTVPDASSDTGWTVSLRAGVELR